MSFVINKERLAPNCPVLIKQAGDLPDVRVKMDFVLVPKAEVKTLQTKSDDEIVPFLVKHTRGWDGFDNPDNEPEAFSPEKLTALLAWTDIRLAVWQGYLDALAGVSRKNVDAGSAGGQTAAPAIAK